MASYCFKNKIQTPYLALQDSKSSGPSLQPPPLTLSLHSFQANHTAFLSCLKHVLKSWLSLSLLFYLPTLHGEVICLLKVLAQKISPRRGLLHPLHPAPGTAILYHILWFIF